MARPVLASKGTVSVVTTNSPAPAYPTGVVANDIVLLQLIKYDNTPGTHSPPVIANFTQIDVASLNNSLGQQVGYVTWYWRRATGALSGTIAITTTGGTGNSTICIGQTYRITGCVTTGNPYDGYDVGQCLAAASAVTWDALKEYHAAETLVVAASGGAGAGLTQPPATPTGITATTAADSSTTGGDGYLLAYTVTTPVDPSVGPFASSTSRAQWGTIGINFVSPAYVHSQISGSDSNGTTTESTKLGLLGVEDYTVPNSQSPGAASGVDVGNHFSPWTNPGNITASDGAIAACTVGADFQASNTLRAVMPTAASLGIPANAVVTGIQFALRCQTVDPNISWLTVYVNIGGSSSVDLSGGTGAPVANGDTAIPGSPQLPSGLTTTDWNNWLNGTSTLNCEFTFQNSSAFGEDIQIDYVYMNIAYNTQGTMAAESASTTTGGGSNPVSSSDANGTTTEAVVEVAVLTATDNGSDSETGKVGLAVIDVNGVVTEAATETAATTATDANGATTEATSLRLSGADSGSDTEAQTLAAQESSADVNGATTETSSVASPVSASDANGATTETTTLALTTTDSGSDTETVTETAALAAIDANAATTEAGKLSLAGTDVNGVTTEQANETAIYAQTDANGVTSEANVLAVAESSSDTGGDSEAASLRLNASDTGSDTEAQTLAARMTDVDSMTDNETATTNTPKSGTDSNSTTTEAVTEIVKTTTTDTGSDTETATYRFPQSTTDANSVTTETGTPKAVESSADANAATTESGSVSAQTFKADTDAGSAQEAASPLARLSSTDSSTGTDTAILGAFITSPDGSGSTVENALLVARLTAAELGVGIDTANMHVTVLSPETGLSVIEAARIGLIGVDSGVGAAEGEILIVNVIDDENGGALESQVLLIHGRFVSPDAPHELLGVKMEQAVLVGAAEPAPAKLTGAKAPAAAKLIGIDSPKEATITKSSMSAKLTKVRNPNG